ncbi:MAG: TonB-dependent receptor [Gammaproteobacteria bacterium]|nr:TonB-dependent receptor [Gammaproteobacteria bacterium]
MVEFRGRLHFLESLMQKKIRRSSQRSVPVKATFLALAGVACNVQAQEATRATSSSDSDAGLEEVLVTATKRGNENLQTVPIAITAESQAALEAKGAQDFEDYARSVPSLSFVDSGPAFKTYVIRGINATGTGVATVGQYVDDILITGDLRQPDLRLVDVQRVEVLRGPQGTLYGSGSLSGTIRTIINPPDPSGYHADVVARASNTEHGSGNYDGALTVNAPLVSDRVTLRATAYDDEESGFINNVRLGTKGVNAEHTLGGRAALLMKLGDATKLTANVFYQRTRTDGRDIVVTADGNLGRYNTDQYVHDPFYSQFKIYNLTLNHDFNWAYLDVSTSYLTRVDDNKFDSTPFDLSFGPNFFTDVVGLSTSDALTDQTDTTKYITNELRLASKLGGRTEFVAGLFQQHIGTTFETLVATSNSQGYLNVPLEPVFGQFQAHKTNQYALFGELSHKLTEKLTGLVGARAFYADESDDLNSTHPFGGFSPPVVTPTLYSHAHRVTPKFYLSYQVTPDAMIYGSVSQGFRIGGGNLVNVMPLPPQDSSYQPDRLWNYEVGAKTSWLDRRLIANTSFYYINWSDIQVTDFTNDTNALTFIANAGKARVYGAEFEVEARPTRSTTLGGTLALVEAQLTQDQPSTNAQFAGHTGDLFPNVPQVSGSLFAQYTHAVTSSLEGFGRVDYSYTGRQGTQFSPKNPIYNVVPAYNLLGVRLGLRSEVWEAALFGRNLLNAYAVNILEEASNLTPRSVVPNRPRTIGIDLRYHY